MERNTMQRLHEWLMPVIFSIVFCALAGFCNAAMDVVSFRYAKSVFVAQGNDTYFDPTKSWVNKWQLDAAGQPIPGKERFPGSSTVFVKFTDFWHLAKSGMICLMMLAVIAYRRAGAPPLHYFADFILCYMAFTGVFSLCFDFLLIR